MILMRIYYQFCLRLLTIVGNFVDKFDIMLFFNVLRTCENTKKKLLNGITFFQNLDNILCK